MGLPEGLLVAFALEHVLRAAEDVVLGQDQAADRFVAEPDVGAGFQVGIQTRDAPDGEQVPVGGRPPRQGLAQLPPVGGRGAAGPARTWAVLQGSPAALAPATADIGNGIQRQAGGLLDRAAGAGDGVATSMNVLKVNKKRLSWGTACTTPQDQPGLKAETAEAKQKTEVLQVLNANAAGLPRALMIPQSADLHGEYLYVSGNDGLLWFKRDFSTGKLSLSGIIERGQGHRRLHDPLCRRQDVQGEGRWQGDGLV